MKEISLNNQDIISYQKNRYPYLMIDVADSITPGKKAFGYKNLTANDWFFKCHFPGDPNMPGLLQIEAIVQMSALIILTLPDNKGKVMYLSKLKNSRFKKKVLIGDKLNIYSELKSFKRGIASFYGKAMVNDKIVCDAEFELVLPDEVEKYKIQIS
jgi:3-hydroxyacyl-[acyl-carrier-protein] dehydratase